MASILKRKDTYKITVFAGRDSNGKKINYYATFTPDSKKTRAQNNKDLDEFSREFERKVKEGSYFDGEYSCAMKSHFRKFGNQMSGSGNHLCNYASLLA